MKRSPAFLFFFLLMLPLLGNAQTYSANCHNEEGASWLIQLAVLF